MTNKNIHILCTAILVLAWSEGVWAKDIFVAAENRQYARGEVLWVSAPKSINETQKITNREVKNAADNNAQAGIIGVSFITNPSGAGNDQSYHIPDDQNFGYPEGWVWTLVGTLTGNFDIGGNFSWSHQLSDVSSTGQKLTEDFQYISKGGYPQKKPGLKNSSFSREVTFANFLGEAKSKNLTLSGTIRIALVCDKAGGCAKLPDHVDIPPVVILIDTPMKNPENDSRAQGIVTHDYTYVHFKKKGTCSFSIDKSEHNIGEFKAFSGISGTPMLLTNKAGVSEWTSVLSLTCTDKKEDHWAKVRFDSANPVVLNGVEMSGTSRPGIGIIYSSENIISCKNGQKFLKILPFSDDVNNTDGKFKDQSKKTVNFGVCQYADNVEPGPINGTIRYEYWVD